MAANRRDYIITHHLRERYIERSQKKYTHLHECRAVKMYSLEYCPTCKLLRDQIRGEIIYEKDKVDEEIHNRLDNADENKSYLNNTSFMEWYHDKYGFDKRFEFLVEGDILFVVVYDEGKKVVVTCVSAKTHLAGKSILRQPKFNRVKKKEEKIVQNFA